MTNRELIDINKIITNDLKCTIAKGVDIRSNRKALSQLAVFIIIENLDEIIE